MQTKNIHISEIKVGDTILRNGIATTVCRNNIGKDSLLGITLFGDSYNAGHKLVTKVEYSRGL